MEYGFGKNTVPGNVYLKYTDTTMNNSIKAVEDGEKLYASFVYGATPDELPKQEYIESTYNAIITAEESLLVDKTELEFLTEFCQGENNDNNYYDDFVWNNFTQAFSYAKTILGNKNSTEEKINSQSWSLLHAYNELCISNQIVGDIDNNGEVNIVDVTRLKLILAYFDTINSSQIFVASTTIYDIMPTIKDVTNIQLYLARLKESITNDSLTYLANNIYSKNWKINILYYYAMRNRYYPF